MSILASGRAAIMLAVTLQALGKVLFGTWLTDISAPLFVLVSFGLTATFFLLFSARGVGGADWGPLLLLNAGTALTFLCFFYALKLIEPAIVGAVEIGIGPVLAVLLVMLTDGERPSPMRLIVCAGILIGCAILAVAALSGSGFASTGRQAWLGLAASAAAGAGAVVITMASRTLLRRGWRFGAVLAHRFYLILPISFIMAWGGDPAPVAWSASLIAALLVVSIVAVLAPLYLLQIGIGRCDTYTVMVTMAALPVVTFLIEGFSPIYSWSWPTALGLGVVSAFLLLDVLAGRGKT